MDNQFTAAEEMLLTKVISTKPYKDIAFLLDKSVVELTSFIDRWLPGKGIVPYQLLVDQERMSRPKVERAPPQKKKKVPVIISRIIPKEQKIRTDRSGRRIFKTRIIDFSQLQQVKIDNKTWLLIEKEECPIAAKIKYQQVLQSSKNISPADRERESNKRIKQMD